MIIAAILTFYLSGATNVREYQVTNVPLYECEALERVGPISGDRPEGRVTVRAKCEK